MLGAIGLILPGLLRIRPGLTPLAAAGLVLIMIGATVITLATMGPATALIPLVVGLLAAFVAYGRWRLAPLRGSSRPSVFPSSGQERPARLDERSGEVGLTRAAPRSCADTRALIAGVPSIQM